MIKEIVLEENFLRNVLFFYFDKSLSGQWLKYGRCGLLSTIRADQYKNCCFLKEYKMWHLVKYLYKRRKQTGINWNAQTATHKLHFDRLTIPTTVCLTEYVVINNIIVTMSDKDLYLPKWPLARWWTHLSV